MAAPSQSMPLFVRPEDVILRMQLSPDLTGIQETVASGIIGAQLHIQQLIGGEFSRKSRDSLFFLDSQAFSGIQPDGVYRLEIPSGMIRRDTTPIIEASAQATVPITPFVERLSIDASLMMIDYERGYVKLDAATYKDAYVRVRCDTGFEDGTTPYPTTGIAVWDNGLAYTKGDKVVVSNVVYIAVQDTTAGDPVTTTKWQKLYVPMEALPQNLYEAILSMVPVIFDASQTTNRNNEAESQYKKAAAHADLLLSSYIRTRGFSFRPL